MVHSLQSKILILIGVIFVATTGSIIFITQKDVKNAVLNTEQKNIENIKNIIHINVEGKYKTLLLDKVVLIKLLKNQIKNENVILKNAINEICRLSDNETDAREQMASWLKTISISSDFFISDKNCKIFFHSKDILKGQSLEEIKDVKSKPVSSSINNTNLPFDKFAVFSCMSIDNKKLAYITTLSRWGWSIGVTNDISRIETETQNKIDEIIKVLKENFDQIKIADTGTIFLFDNLRKILIPPAEKYTPEISNDLLETLMESKNSDSPSKILLNQTEINAYTSHIKALDWYITALVPVEEIKSPANKLAAGLSQIIGGIFLIGLFVLIIAVRRFSGPLKSLTMKIKDIPSQDLTSPELTLSLKQDFFTKRKDEVGALANSFIYMFQELQKNIKQLIATTAAKERIESELNVARDIQLGILPKIFPPYPEKDAFTLHAYLEPAREVGGDLYDFFLLDEDHLCVSIGDVSDKGVPAALFMVITKTLIKTYSDSTRSASDIVTKINEVLSKDNPNCMFVTLLIGILNIRTGEMRYINAGHNPPLIKSGNETFYQKGLSGPIAGAMEGIEYKELSLTLKKGDMLLFYTDGVTEAMNSEKKLFSDDRLKKLIESSDTVIPKDIIASVNRDLKNFTAGTAQSDDITMLALVFKGEE
ncbi:putative Protein serine/threonine phosphatase [Desulfamplus magnetovallimortis]|uniref:HAMP domain-containing protein n=1 Tax=Desulfamplus magnetovallimortis TaxID=1246637 RepID=L0R5K8_9BACT|nr:SpoIIE family protein phosphatase [Desulfamplus magnetovallimortis]CCO06807.1 putative Protein serine/threonine phosphatase [Desulfamplus magnetovallimortis BW-1]SLM32858.1 putative Protein serine/threonine phosphatase [Desulfamplus magnetovallimortis]